MPTNKIKSAKESLISKYWKWTTRESLGYILLITISMIFLYGATKKTIENLRLAKSGTIVKAIVINKQKVGGKGTIDLTVKYYVGNREFEGSLTNEPWDISDTVNILYLNSDPTVIRSYDFIKENYSTDIRLK